MPFIVPHEILCPACPFGVCVEDRRVNRVRGRATNFRIKQNVILNCTFEHFVPGTDSDPDPSRTFDQYLNQHQINFRGAGHELFPNHFSLNAAAVAKVLGDAFQTIESAALWNVAAAWNELMDTGCWTSQVFKRPPDAVPTPLRKIAVVTLPRGYDATRLFRESVRNALEAHERAIAPMELGMSSPDVVGVRIPEPIPSAYLPFLSPLPNLGEPARAELESAYQRIEGTLEGHSFLFAIAVKRTIRSDRLYQPLFEANVLKYLVQEVLRGATFRFHVHVGSMEGADAVRRYNAPSLASLLRGGQPALAVDKLWHATHPRDAAQVVLDDFPRFHQ